MGGGLAVAGVLAFIGHRILSGEKSVGDFTGYVAALLLAAQPARALGNLNAILQEALAALSRTFALMDEAPTIREKPGAPDLAVAGGEVRFEGVRFRYRDETTPRRSRASTSSCRPAAPRPSSAVRARASRRCSPWCRGSTT